MTDLFDILDDFMMKLIYKDTTTSHHVVSKYMELDDYIKHEFHNREYARLVYGTRGKPKTAWEQRKKQLNDQLAELKELVELREERLSEISIIYNTFLCVILAAVPASLFYIFTGMPGSGFFIVWGVMAIIVILIALAYYGYGNYKERLDHEKTKRLVKINDELRKELGIPLRKEPEEFRD